jgi:nucleotide-binding universal stress UspA family protein
MFRKILVAYDGSEGSKKALGIGIELAKRLEVDLHSISVVEGLPYFAATVGEVEEVKNDVEAYFKKITKEAWDQAALHGVDLHATILPGHEVENHREFHQEGTFPPPDRRIRRSLQRLRENHGRDGPEPDSFIPLHGDDRQIATIETSWRHHGRPPADCDQHGDSPALYLSG